jgi:C4-dicarboxylate-specific signal transduction histidine kinase
MGSIAPTADRAQLAEVLMNLATNDSICENGEGPRKVEMCARLSDAGHVRIAIRDTGKGIDPKLMPRLFDAFFTTKPTGLGIDWAAR